MTTVATFAAAITDAGNLAFLFPPKVAAFLKTLAGRRVNVTIAVPREKRTGPQNRYLHAEPFKKIADHTGESVERTKLSLMGNCWGWEPNKLTGEPVPVQPHTSRMTVKECTFFIDWLLPWALEFFNGSVDIMPPQQWFELHPEAMTDDEEA